MQTKPSVWFKFILIQNLKCLKIERNNKKPSLLCSVKHKGDILWVESWFCLVKNQYYDYDDNTNFVNHARDLILDTTLDCYKNKNSFYQTFFDNNDHVKVQMLVVWLYFIYNIWFLTANKYFGIQFFDRKVSFIVKYPCSYTFKLTYIAKKCCIYSNTKYIVI